MLQFKSVTVQVMLCFLSCSSCQLYYGTFVLYCFWEHAAVPGQEVGNVAALFVG